MVWSDEPPNDFNWKPVRLTVKKLVSYAGGGKKVVDVLQSRTGNNMCSTRAIGPMLEAWHALGDALSKRRNLDGTGGVWKTKDAARQAVDRVHERTSTLAVTAHRRSNAVAVCRAVLVGTVVRPSFRHAAGKPTPAGLSSRVRRALRAPTPRPGKRPARQCATLTNTVSNELSKTITSM